MGKSCPSREFLASQICLLTLFAKIKFSRKFPDLQFGICVKDSNKPHADVGECLLIPSLPGKERRTFVDITRLAER